MITSIPNVNNGLTGLILTWIFCPSSWRIYEEDNTLPFSKQSAIVKRVQNSRYQVSGGENFLFFHYSLYLQH